MTVRIPVSAARGDSVYAIVDEVDAHLSERSWRLRKGYVVTRVYAGKRNGKSRQRQVAMHRLIMDLQPGDPREVDHQNRDPLDNTRDNLRVVTRSQNAQNVGARRRTRNSDKPAARGVNWHEPNRQWLASVQSGGRALVRRYFDADDFESAVEWVREQRARLFPFSEEGRGYAKV